MYKKLEAIVQKKTATALICNFIWSCAAIKFENATRKEGGSSANNSRATGNFFYFMLGHNKCRLFAIDTAACNKMWQKHLYERKFQPGIAKNQQNYFLNNQ